MVDEADEYLFSDPKSFNDFVGDRRCLGFTSTAGSKNTNFDIKSAVISSLGFTRLDYWPEEPANKDGRLFPS